MEDAKCEYCHKLGSDHDSFIRDKFQLWICRSCKDQNRELFGLLTKTRAKSIYLLNDQDLDVPHITKPNPRSLKWNPMSLYLVYQIEQVAVNKFGSLAEIERLKRDRHNLMVAKREKTIRQQLRETKTRMFIERDSSHKHDFVTLTDTWKCRTCGMEIHTETF